MPASRVEFPPPPPHRHRFRRPASHRHRVHTHDIRQLALHRIITAELLNTEVVPLDGFDLDTYIQQGAFGWHVGETGFIQLIATFSQGAAPSVTERLLSPEQSIEELPDGSVRIVATVADTKALRVWLLGFGDQVVVEEPVGLRHEILQTAQAMCRNYGA